MADRIQLLQWQGHHANPVGAYVSIHALEPDDTLDAGDYAGIYRSNDRWAVWGLVRKGRKVSVWHGPSGPDFGLYDTVAEALAAIEIDSIRPLAARTR